MKILHVPFTFYPDPVGGTEIYVETLALQLQRLQINSVIAAPANQNDRYEYRGICVHRYANEAVTDLRSLYGEGDPTAANAFGRLLALERPDIVHLHAFTRGVSLALVRKAKSRGIPVVFTYHTPTVTCQRGTMMRGGTQPCEGRMDVQVCAPCALEKLIKSHGGLVARKQLARNLAHIIGALPSVLGSWISRRNLQGGLWTALRTRELIQLRHANTRALFAEVDHVVAVSQWVKDTLRCNGVPEDKITLCRQGVFEEPEIPNRESEPVSCEYSSPLKIAFLGRYDSTKGLDILVQALRSVADAPLRLDIFGVAQGESGRLYEQELRRLAATDPRVEFHPPLSGCDVVATLRRHDLLAVPSQLLETGPLVVLEAFAAGIPVIGSRLGGIAEIVRDGIDGILVESATLEAWSRVLYRLTRDRSIIQSLRRNVHPPRAMISVAKEMAVLYKQILGNSRVQFRSASWLFCKRRDSVSISAHRAAHHDHL